MGHMARSEPPEYLRLDTVRAWVDRGGVATVMSYQVFDEARRASLNPGYVLAWLSVSTGHFGDPRWWREVKLPDPATGEWPKNGSASMRQEIRIACHAIDALLANGRVPRLDGAALAEYAVLCESAAVEADKHRKPDPSPAPPPPPKPRPQPNPAPEPAPKKPGLKWLAWLVPLVSLVLYFLPIPEPIKIAIRALLELIGG